MLLTWDFALRRCARVILPGATVERRHLWITGHEEGPRGKYAAWFVDHYLGDARPVPCQVNAVPDFEQISADL
jgi:hypothetical protein